MPSDAAPAGAAPDATRRRLLGAGVAALGAGIGAATLVPALANLGYPLQEPTVSGTEEFLEAGPASQFGEVPLKVELRADRVDAWSRVDDVKVGSAWVLRAQGQLVAFSAVCPHLGCAIDWDGDAGRFACPCHDSTFERDGACRGGPAPRGLDRLEVQENDGLVKIRWRRFPQGATAAEAARAP